MQLNVALAQYPITQFSSFEQWQSHTQKWIAQAAQKKAHLIVFPEYATMELVSLMPLSVQGDIRAQIMELAQYRADFCAVFTDLAKKHETIIVAPSMPVSENGRIVNRTYVFSSKGLVGHQDKFFMTRFEAEEWGIQAASPKELSLFEANWGRFGIQICYDIEFALGSHELCKAGATLILAPSCTETTRGASRVHIGARARALENQCYTLVSQVVGNALWSPAVDVNYGYAACYSTPDKFFRENGIIAQKRPQAIGWLSATLDLSLLDLVRKEGQVFNFR